MLENSAKVEGDCLKNALERQKNLQRHFAEVRQRIDAEFDELSKTLEKRREVLVRQFEALQRQQLSLLHSSSRELNGEQCCVAVEFTGQESIRDFLASFGRIRAGRGSNIYDIEPCKLEEFREREFNFDKEIVSMKEENNGDIGGKENEESSSSNSNIYRVCDSNNKISINSNDSNIKSDSIKERMEIKETTSCDANGENKLNTTSIDRKTDSDYDSISKDNTKTNSDCGCNKERRDNGKDITRDTNSDSDSKSNSNNNSPINTNSYNNAKNDTIDAACCDANNDNNTNSNTDDKCCNINTSTSTRKNITDASEGDAHSNADYNKRHTNAHEENKQTDINADCNSDQDGAPSNSDEKLEPSNSNGIANPREDEIVANGCEKAEILCANANARVSETKEESIAFEGREHPEQVKQWLEQILLETDLEPSVNEVERINLHRVLIN